MWWKMFFIEPWVAPRSFATTSVGSFARASQKSRRTRQLYANTSRKSRTPAIGTRNHRVGIKLFNRRLFARSREAVPEGILGPPRGHPPGLPVRDLRGPVRRGPAPRVLRDPRVRAPGPRMGAGGRGLATRSWP